MSNAINIVSYNVLSSHLGGADYFTSCLPDYLAPRYRLTKLQEVLEEHMSREAIICLQEVSTPWLGHLHSFFLNHDYYLISGMYGHRMNGYMGVCIAVPMNKYKIIDTDIKTISDTKNAPAKKSLSPSNSILSSLLSYLSSIIDTLSKASLKVYFSLTGLKAPENAWSVALSRFNQMVSVRLQSKLNISQRFVVGNYHMPCIFDKPQVMMIHTSLSAKYLQRRAKDDPFIYCGDFNSKPDSAMYRLMTQAIVDDQVNYDSR
jgi:2',5'-phosphodiesterase